LNFFDLYHGNYKKLLVVPAIVFIVVLFVAFVFPGIKFGIDFSGGTSLRFKTNAAVDSKQFEAILDERYELTDLKVESVSSPVGYGIILNYVENVPIVRAEKELTAARSLIDSDSSQAIVHINNALSAISKFAVPDETPSDPKALLSKAESTLAKAKENFFNQLKDLLRSEFAVSGEIPFEVKEIGPALGSAFWETALQVGIAAFILIVLVIFIFFREIIPSMAVIAAAVFDGAFALALMAVFDINLSISTIPALLMLVGYSVDTDIMLTTRLLMRKEGTAADRTVGAMKTGLTMTFTTLAALTAMLVLSYLTQIVVIFEIAAVILFGLLGDLISTWFMNAPVLLWYVQKKKERFPGAVLNG